LDRRLRRSPAEATVRPARATDEPFVVGLAGRFAETRPDWRSEREVTAGTEAELRRAFREPDAGLAILIAEDDSGAPVGFAYAVTHRDFFTHEEHGHLSEIATARDGSGAFVALVAAVEAHFRGLGVRFVTLNVNVGNERAAELYARLGFEKQVVQFVKTLR
jgi:ribosomal protein S18 acetylase RimI-like enzyme